MPPEGLQPIKLFYAYAHEDEHLHDELAKRGITLRVAEARAGVRDLLRAGGLEEKVGRVDRLTTVADVIGGTDLGSEDRPHEGGV